MRKTQNPASNDLRDLRKSFVSEDFYVATESGAREAFQVLKPGWDRPRFGQPGCASDLTLPRPPSGWIG